MTEEEQDFTIWKDKDYNIHVTVTFDEEFFTPLTNLTIVWGMSVKSESSTALITKDNALLGGITVLSDTEFLVEIDREDTADLARGKYYHEAIVIDDTDNVSIIMVGTITIKESLLPIEVVVP